MDRYYLLIYPVLLIILSLIHVRVYPKKEFSPSFWNQAQGKNIQAIACLGIILHHLTQRYTTYATPTLDNPITILNSCGILFTAIFFFFSGYGLMQSLIHKPDYVKSFLGHRLPLVVIPFYLIHTIFVLFSIFGSKYHPTFPVLLTWLSGFVLLNSECWFIIEILYFYIVFYLLFRFIRKKDIALVLFCLSAFFIMYLGYHGGHDESDLGAHWFKGEWWYNATIAFPMGAIIGRFQKNIVTFFKKYYIPALITSLLLFVTVFILEESVLAKYGYYNNMMVTPKISGQFLTFILQSLLCIQFLWLVLILNMKIEIGNKILSKIGLISLELYMIHDLYIRTLFPNTKIPIVLKYGLVILLGILTATLIHLVAGYLRKFLTAVARKIKTLFSSIKKQEKIEKDHSSHKKRILWIIAILIFLFLLFVLYIQVVRPRVEGKHEMKNLETAQVGDTVFFGRYPTSKSIHQTERVSWIVLKKEGNQLMLITQYGLTGGPYNQAKNEVNWNHSDLYHRLNQELYQSLFSEIERQYLVPNPSDKALVSLLSVEEAKELFETDYSRELTLTESAILEGNANYNILSKIHDRDMKGYHSSWWWLRGSSEYSINAPYVSIEGKIIEDSYNVSRRDGAIRPVIWVTYLN